MSLSLSSPDSTLDEHDPVVVAVGLVAEHGDVELLGATAGQDLLDGAGAGHAVADHDQPRGGAAVVDGGVPAAFP